MYNKISHHLIHDLFSRVRVSVELKLDRELVHAFEDNLQREVVLGLVCRQHNNFWFHAKKNILDSLLRRVPVGKYQGKVLGWLLCWYMWDPSHRPSLPLIFWRNASFDQRKNFWVCHLGKTVRFEALLGERPR